LKHGLCEYSPAAFALTGVLLAGVKGDLAGGAVYGKYSLLLLEKLESKGIESRTMFLAHSFVLHWTAPAQSMMQPLMKAYEVGMQTGDTESAMQSIYHQIVLGFVSGRSSLDALEHDCRTYSMQMKELKQERVMNDCKMTWQMILNLMGNSKHKVVLTGEALDEDACTVMAKDNPYLSSMLQVHRLLMRSFYGDHYESTVVERSSTTALDESSNTIPPGSPFIVLATFHQGLSFLAMARRRTTGTTTSSTNNDKHNHRHKSEARKRLGTIRKWRTGGNPNVKHYEALLEAELANVDGRKKAANFWYINAVDLATRGGFLPDAALANERFGAFLLHGMNDKEEATVRLKRACSGFCEWGAHGKVESMEETYATLLPPATRIPEIKKVLT
jgi:hypothetical protein